MTRFIVWLAVVLVLVPSLRSQEQSSFEYGEPEEMRGLTKLHIDAGTDVDLYRIMRRVVEKREPRISVVPIDDAEFAIVLTGRKADFFTFRHTGASHLAEKTKNPILIVKMMGDTNVETVMRHYFNLDVEFMAEMVSGWVVPLAVTPTEDARSEFTN